MDPDEALLLVLYALNASCTMSGEDSWLTKIILDSGARVRICRADAIPFSAGSPMSRRIKSGFSSSACRTASAPSETSQMICKFGHFASVLQANWRKGKKSSTTIMRIAALSMLKQGPVAYYLYIVKGTLCRSFSQDGITTVNLQRRTVTDDCLRRIEFSVSSNAHTTICHGLRLGFRWSRSNTRFSKSTDFANEWPVSLSRLPFRIAFRPHGESARRLVFRA